MSEVERITFPALELRLGDLSERIVEGVVVPWDEVSFLTADPKGERFIRGALTRSLADRGDRVKLFLSHDHSRAVGTVVRWRANEPEGCWGSFKIRGGDVGDELLADVRDGLLDGF